MPHSLCREVILRGSFLVLILMVLSVSAKGVLGQDSPSTPSVPGTLLPMLRVGPNPGPEIRRLELATDRLGEELKSQEFLMVFHAPQGGTALEFEVAVEGITPQTNLKRVMIADDLTSLPTIPAGRTAYGGSIFMNDLASSNGLEVGTIHWLITKANLNGPPAPPAGTAVINDQIGMPYPGRFVRNVAGVYEVYDEVNLKQSNHPLQLTTDLQLSGTGLDSSHAIIDDKPFFTHTVDLFDGPTWDRQRTWEADPHSLPDRSVTFFGANTPGTSSYLSGADTLFVYEPLLYRSVLGNVAYSTANMYVLNQKRMVYQLVTTRALSDFRVFHVVEPFRCSLRHSTLVAMSALRPEDQMVNGQPTRTLTVDLLFTLDAVSWTPDPEPTPGPSQRNLSNGSWTEQAFPITPWIDASNSPNSPASPAAGEGNGTNSGGAPSM